MGMMANIGTTLDKPVLPIHRQCGAHPVMDVYVNGEMVDGSEANIPFHDAGVQHGVGLFETMGVYGGRVFRLEAHLRRLSESAQSLGLTPDLDVDRCHQAIDQTIQHNELVRARLRLTVTAGTTSWLRTAPHARHPPTPTVLVEASRPTEYDPAYFEKGIMVLVGPPAAHPFDRLAGHKTLSYWHRLITLRQAASAGGGEVIWLNSSNHLASGAVSNLFLVKEGALFTPIARGEEVVAALPAPVRPGVTRAAVIEQAAQMNLSVTRRMLSVADLLEADEVFLTNTSWLVLPVKCVEKKQIGHGQVGPVTTRLRDAILNLIDRETSDRSL